MRGTHARQLWYGRPGVVLAALIVFWPLGLLLVWTQKKYTLAGRAGLSVALPLISVLIVMVATAGIGSPPSLKDPVATAFETAPPAVVTTEVPSSNTSAAAVTSPAIATTADSPIADTDPAASAKAAPTSAPEKTPDAALEPPTASDPAPDPTPAQAGAPQSRFTLNGSITPAGACAFTLKAGKTSGITKYEWWVTAIDVTTRYTGPSVTEAYVGHFPQSVLLVTTDAAGKEYVSQAAVSIADSLMFAEAK